MCVRVFFPSMYGRAALSARVVSAFLFKSLHPSIPFFDPLVSSHTLTYFVSPPLSRYVNLILSSPSVIMINPADYPPLEAAPSLLLLRRR